MSGTVPYANHVRCCELPLQHLVLQIQTCKVSVQNTQMSKKSLKSECKTYEDNACRPKGKVRGTTVSKQKGKEVMNLHMTVIEGSLRKLPRESTDTRYTARMGDEAEMAPCSMCLYRLWYPGKVDKMLSFRSSFQFTCPSELERRRSKEHLSERRAITKDVSVVSST